MVQTWLDEIRAEYERARVKFPAFHSTHEGYAVILEEIDELWQGIKLNDEPQNLATEAVQVAAMALAFLVECTGIELDADEFYIVKEQE